MQDQLELYWNLDVPSTVELYQELPRRLRELPCSSKHISLTLHTFSSMVSAGRRCELLLQLPTYRSRPRYSSPINRGAPRVSHLPPVMHQPCHTHYSASANAMIQLSGIFVDNLLMPYPSHRCWPAFDAVCVGIACSRIPAYRKSFCFNSPSRKGFSIPLDN